MLLIINQWFSFYFKKTVITLEKIKQSLKKLLALFNGDRMKKLKIPISRFKLFLSLLLITTFLMIIKTSMNYHENGTLGSILSSAIHWVFFISLFFVFLEKKRLFLLFLLFSFPFFYLFSFRL
jgi:hypothetical protein